MTAILCENYFNRKSVEVQPCTPLDIMLNGFCLKIIRLYLCCTCNGRVSRCCHIESTFTGPPDSDIGKLTLCCFVSCPCTTCSLCVVVGAWGCVKECFGWVLLLWKSLVGLSSSNNARVTNIICLLLIFYGAYFAHSWQGEPTDAFVFGCFLPLLDNHFLVCVCLFHYSWWWKCSISSLSTKVSLGSCCHGGAVLFKYHVLFWLHLCSCLG